MSQTKIIRRPDFAGGGITPEEKSLMDAHTAKWIANAMSTEPVDSTALTLAIERLYEVSGLKKPRVVVVPSPLVMAFAGGFSAAIWWRRRNGATISATTNATDSAIDNATASATANTTNNATYNATISATISATRNTTRNTTYNATISATTNATDSAIDNATISATTNATDSATRNATDSATRETINKEMYELAMLFGGAHQEAMFLLSCAAKWSNMYQGGNMWSAWDCFLSAARDILGLRLPVHEKYAAWEDCAKLGGFRVMHEEFCIVSDRPEILRVDEQNRPHCDDGPSHRWRDGWSLYHIHGVAVPADVVEAPHLITVELIDAEQNAEVRRIMIERYKRGAPVSGTAAFIRDSGAELLDYDEDHGRLLRRIVKDDEPIVMVHVLNPTPEPDSPLSETEARQLFGTKAVDKAIKNFPCSATYRHGAEPRFKEYFLRVDPELRPMKAGKVVGEGQKMTCRNAVASTWGLTGKEFAPEFMA